MKKVPGISMKRLYPIILISLLSIHTSTGWTQQLMMYQPEQMQADLKKFKTALIKIHPGTYTHQSPKEFEQVVNRLMQRTTKPMKATAFYKIVLKLIAHLHDGHTQAYTFGKLGKIINNQKRLPFQVYIRNERIFIIKNLSTHKIPEGSEILALDGHLSNEIIAKILAHYSADGKSQQGMCHWLGGPYKSFYRLYPEVYKEQAWHKLVYRDYKTKKIVATNIQSISKKTYQKIEAARYPVRKGTEEAFSFKMHKNHAYLKINRFVKDGFNEPESTYIDFYRQCFKEIALKKTKKLIIDLRDNGGGKASNAAYLLQYFIDKPLTPAKEIVSLGNDAYFLKATGKRLRLDSVFGLKPTTKGTFKVSKTEVLRDLMNYKPIEKYPYNGKLIVLINGGTTSAAGIAAGLLKAYTGATFVGEETYGYAGLSNGVRQVSIKGDHTETAIYLPLLHAKYAMDEHLQKRSVVPDYQVANAVQDILSDNDAVLEFVLRKLWPVKTKR